MTKTIKDYYQAEMQILTEATQGFAQAHPTHAARLNLDVRGDRDPHIERLLEGSAYLNARVKQQIDLGANHLSEAILRQLAPQYLTPYPSMTIIEYTSPGHRLNKNQIIPAGIQLRSMPVGEEQTTCEFTTTQALTVYPLHLVSVEGLSSNNALELSFELNEGVEAATVVLQDLPLFINGSAAVAAQWYFYLTTKVAKITIKYENGDERLIGGQNQLSSMYLNDFTSMLPPLSRHIKAFEMLSDYFLFPERFWFVKLEPIGTLEGQTFKIMIEFTEMLPNLRIPAQFLKLHCVPASNVFSTHFEPVRYHKNHSEYPLIISRDQPLSKSLLAIKRISGIKKQGLERINLIDFHQLPNLKIDQCHFRLSQVSEREENVTSHLIFSGSMPEEMHISGDVYACNGNYPRQYLHANALFLKDERVSMQLEATNLSKPSRFYTPQFDSQYTTNVLSSINTRFQMLADVEYLKKILHLHDWSGRSTLHIDAIDSIQLNPFTRLSRGMIIRGVIFVLTIGDASSTSLPELYLLGTVLHHFIYHLAPINTVIETVMVVLPSGQRFEWK